MLYAIAMGQIIYDGNTVPYDTRIVRYRIAIVNSFVGSTFG